MTVPVVDALEVIDIENRCTEPNDGQLFEAMLGRNEHSNQLRQSPPYVGLLPREVVRRLNEEAAA